MHYECRECGSPAVTLPEQLDENAYVLCRECHSPVATWAVFKRITTQAVLADVKETGPGSHPISYDPLDPGLLRVVEGRYGSSL
jgi:DNA-directed RNA polymerase subunit RPC12/RpoP